MRAALEGLRHRSTPAGHDGDAFRLSPAWIERIADALEAGDVHVTNRELDPPGAPSIHALDATKADIIRQWNYGNLTPLGVANALRKAGFNMQHAVDTANHLASDKGRAPVPVWTRVASDQVRDLHEANNTLEERARVAERALRAVQDVTLTASGMNQPLFASDILALLPPTAAVAPAPAQDAPPPPWPIGQDNPKRAGWEAFFAGKPRDKCPFPAAMHTLHAYYREGWDRAQAWELARA